MSEYRLVNMTDAELAEAMGFAKWHRKHLYQTLQRYRAGGEIDENSPECRAYDRACIYVNELIAQADLRAKRKPEHSLSDRSSDEPSIWGNDAYWRERHTRTIADSIPGIALMGGIWLVLWYGCRAASRLIFG